MNKLTILSLTVPVFGLAISHGQVTDPNQLCASEASQGFKMIFDGTAASFRNQFVDYQRGSETNTNLSANWQLNATEKAITTTGATGAPDTRSRFKVKTVPGFDLRWSYRNPANQGVIYLMTVAGGQIWSTGIEFGIDNLTTASKVGPGAAYDIFPPTPNSYYLYNTNKWNDARIVVVGDSVEHWMNGVQVVGFKYHNQRFWNAYNASKWNAGNELTNAVAGQRGALGQGYITNGYWGFQADHGGTWLIRSLRIDSVAPAVGTPKNSDWQRGTMPCGTTEVKDEQVSDKYTLKGIQPQVHQSPGQFTVEFARLPLKEALLTSLDGRSILKANLSEGSTRAVFTGDLKSGVYLLRVRDAKIQVIRKVRIF